MEREKLSNILLAHKKWLLDEPGGIRADLSGAVLTNADLSGAVLRWADLRRAELTGADLTGAELTGAVLRFAVLTGADLTGAVLNRADLTGAVLDCVTGLIKTMGVEPGNTYWKRFCGGLNNNGFQFYIGRNDLPLHEIFAADPRTLCSYPGFHFASRSWCAMHYPDRPLEARIRIPADALINEPWATDGKASASTIEILQVFDTATGEDVTEQYRRTAGKDGDA